MREVVGEGPSGVESPFWLPAVGEKREGKQRDVCQNQVGVEEPLHLQQGGRTKSQLIVVGNYNFVYLCFCGQNNE